MQILVNIDVDDLGKAIAFYRDGLGLRLERCLFDNTVAEMSGASSTVHLLQKTAATVPAPGALPRDYRRHWTAVHLDFVVDDIEAALARARTAGAVLETGIGSCDWGRLATLSDPFGNGFCLLQLSADGYPS